jgi:hypothetical protein
MLLPTYAQAGSMGSRALSSIAENPIWKRSANDSTSTISELTVQWTNPSDVSTILMIIGGEVVRNALAQSTGTWFTPVCFSFGWVSYAFLTLVSVVGDGRLLPPPDYPVKVINLQSGYARDNRSWVVGRILRDAEAWIERREPLNNAGIRIAIFEAEKRRSDNPTKFYLDKSHLYGAGVIVLQLLVASVPVIRSREWGVMLITAVGTILVQITGWLPQWRAEKLPNRQTSKSIYALTTGNGSKDIIVIFGNGQCLDLEELCVSSTPRVGRSWEKFLKYSEPRLDPDGINEPQALHRIGTGLRKSRQILGLPYGFMVTRVVAIGISILWLLLLINVAAIKASTWYLLLVGAIGMFQNGILAAMERPPAARNLPLRHADTIIQKKVMDGIMDFEYTYGCGEPLLREFFNAALRTDEQAWWNGEPDNYDATRERERGKRGVPRRFLPSIKPTSRRTSTTTVQKKSPVNTGLSSEKLPGSPPLEPATSNLQKRTSVSFAVDDTPAAAQAESTKSSSADRRVASPSRFTMHRTIDEKMLTRISSEQGTSEQTSAPLRNTLSAEEVEMRAASPSWAL